MRLLGRFFLIICCVFAVIVKLHANEVGECDYLKLYVGDTKFSDNCEPEDAFNKVKRDAEHGNEIALYILGRIYELGGSGFGLEMVESDLDKSMQYYKKSADKGYAEGQFAYASRVARMHGISTPREVNFLFCKAAMQGHYAARVNIEVFLKYKKFPITWKQYCNDIVKGDAH